MKDLDKPVNKKFIKCYFYIWVFVGIIVFVMGLKGAMNSGNTAYYNHIVKFLENQGYSNVLYTGGLPSYKTEYNVRMKQYDGKQVTIIGKIDEVDLITYHYYMIQLKKESKDSFLDRYMNCLFDPNTTDGGTLLDIKEDDTVIITGTYKHNALSGYISDAELIFWLQKPQLF